MISENEFMIDMIDDGDVLVDAKKLRTLLKSLHEWEQLVATQSNKLLRQATIIDNLKTSIEVLKSKTYVKVDLEV